MNLRMRALLVTVLLSFGFTIVSLRLVQIQIVDAEKYEEEAIRNHFVKISVPARRGSVQDARGVVLSQTLTVYDIRLDGKELKNPEQTLSLLAEKLGLTRAKIQELYDPEKRYVLLQTNVGEEQMNDLKSLKIKGLIFEKKMLRTYPNHEHASQVIGFLDERGRGGAGVERAFDKELRGVSGERWMERDVKKREIAAFRRKDVRAIDGKNVQLTLDLSIQHVVEEELTRVMAKSGAVAVSAIVMRPKTGEILAMANRPTFDPNDRETFKMANLRNRCLTDLVEPGSTFKIVTLAGILQEGMMNLDTSIFCENGSFYYGDRWLHDDEPHGMLPVRQVMAHSSNIGFAKMGITMGEEKVYEYAKNFGFGKITGTLPSQGESAGILNPLSRWSKVSITRVPIGHEVGATPIQMISAISVIANGGRLMEPHLIKSVTDSQGRIIEIRAPKVIRQVISESVARQVSEAMKLVVIDGTGKRASVPGFAVAGKTGTAQKVVGGTYSKEKYLASFIGFMPEENPEFALLVMVDEPKGREYHGGQIAAPAFSAMANQIAQCLNLVPKSLPASMAIPEAKL